MTIYRVCGVYSSESHTEVYCVRLNFSTEIGLLTFDIVLLYIKQKKWNSCFCSFTEGKQHKVCKLDTISYIIIH